MGSKLLLPVLSFGHAISFFVNVVLTSHCDEAELELFRNVSIKTDQLVLCKKRSKLQLELKYAAEIISLVPPHQYVPWIVVDVQPLYEDYEIFIDYICMAYKGNLVPKACGNLFLITNHYGDQTRACLSS
ncbi:hypothetical protein WN944_006954 [Citrus x changshan-huyou]|uniref:Uncharacterized protein n=1 Tax=Citrus x changshan-huyou TaxID=2935761 RepID=A0AAP0QXM1_9ROSI